MKQPDTASICSNLDSSYSKKIFKSNPSKHNLCEKRIKRSVIRLNYEKIAQNLLDAINDLGSELDVNMHVCVLLSNGTKEFGVVVEISSICIQPKLRHEVFIRLHGYYFTNQIEALYSHHTNNTKTVSKRNVAHLEVFIFLGLKSGGVVKIYNLNLSNRM